MQRARQLVVNADDFGFTRGVNEGIVSAHRTGIVSATSLMADGPAFDHAVELARQNPSLDVGVHLVLWPENEGLPRRLPSFLAQAARCSVAEIETGFCRQVEKIAATGIAPSHLDTHKHVHWLPRVMEAVVRVAGRFGIRWVRRPVFRSQATRRGLQAADHFAGIRLTGRLDSPRLLAALSRLRPGVTEFMCHPGICDAELERAPTRLKQARQVELEALTNPAVRLLLERSAIVLTSFRALDAPTTAAARQGIREATC